MADRSRSVPPEHFENKYQADPDPWGYETRPYEAGKYAATLAALPRPTYANALEIGCSIGVLTERLAERCSSLLAVDVSEKALTRARKRCRHLAGVRFQRLEIPGQYPAGGFDLIVVSEVGYYWSSADLLRARDRIIESLDPGGHLLLVHWTPAIDDAPLTGDVVHDVFCATVTTLEHRASRSEETYRLDLFVRHDTG
jgi:SAM-dependent methyltransferase